MGKSKRAPEHYVNNRDFTKAINDYVSASVISLPSCEGFCEVALDQDNWDIDNQGWSLSGSTYRRTPRGRSRAAL